MNSERDFLKVGESLRPEVTSGGAVDNEDGVLEKWHTSRDSVDEYLEMRAKNANSLGWRLLDQAPDVTPLPGDELCEN